MKFFWGCFSYIFGVLIATWIVGKDLQKKNKFFLRSLLCFTISIFVLYGYDLLVALIPTDNFFYFPLRMCDCLIVFTLALLSFKVCFISDIWAMLFCVTAGYCMQHIAKTISTLLGYLLPVSDNVFLTEGILILVTACVYFLLDYFIIKKTHVNKISVDNAIQILVALIVMLCLMFFYLISLRITGRYQNSVPLRVIVNIFSMVIASISFAVEFGLMINRRLIEEKEALRRMLQQERKQYHIDQERIESINIKCHDIKDHLSILKEMKEEEKNHYIGELEKEVLFFDSHIKTGDETLDMLLAEKTLVCEPYKIRFACIADGKQLKIMKVLDIYSLFSNAIGNAIECVRNISDEEKRIITIRINAKNQFLCINIENYYEKKIEFSEGLPVTSKGDKNSHGFGMKSIQHTVEKYNGNLVIDTEKNLFSLGIFIPISQE